METKEQNVILKAYNYFKEVFRKTEKTRVISLSHQESRQLHAAMGLAGEAGEVLELYKKRMFGYKYQDIRRADLVKELGDCLWYYHLMLESTGITIEEILTANADKLSERYKDMMGEPPPSNDDDDKCSGGCGTHCLCGDPDYRG